MATFDSASFSTDAFSVLAFDIEAGGAPSLPDVGTAIENLTATTDAGNRYEICDRSGFRAKPGQLKETWDGLMVLPQFWEPRNYQDLIETRPEEQRGPERPEPIGSETFIDPDNPVSIDDL